MALSQKFAVLLAVAAAAGLGSIRASAADRTSDTLISSFTQGDIVVMRTGDLTHSDGTGGAYNNGTAPVYLDEYTVTGSYVGTMTVSAASGAQNELTMPGQSQDQHEGNLSLSANGLYLTFAGYNADLSTTISANSVPTDGKRIGIIGNSATSLSTSTVVSAYNGSNPYIRGAAVYSTDVNGNPNAFYTFGKYTSGGIQYVTGTGPSASTAPIEAYADVRVAGVVNGQLYAGSGSSGMATGGAAGHALYSVTGGTPTSQLNTSTQANGVDNTQVTAYNGSLTTAESVSAFAFVTITGPTSSATDPTSGANILYTIGDQSGLPATIVKYNWNGSQWTSGPAVTFNSNDLSDPTGLTDVIDPSNSSWVDIYASGVNGIYSYIDKSGDPTAAIAANSFTQIVTPDSYESFRGLAFAPTSVPEPASLSLLAIGGLSLLARRRKH